VVAYLLRTHLENMRLKLLIHDAVREAEGNELYRTNRAVLVQRFALYDFSRVLGDPSQVYHLREDSNEVRAMATRRRFFKSASDNSDERRDRPARLGS